MRKILLIAIILFSIGCKGQPNTNNIPQISGHTGTYSLSDSTQLFKRKVDSLKYENDSLKTALIRANFFKIRVNYYRTITNKNPKKFTPFFRGWINGLFENQ